MKKIWNFFCSVKLTIVLFVLILLPSVVGTIIQQNAPDPSRYAEMYGPVWDRVFRLLGFYDIYHDPRFIVLLFLLGLNTFACTVKRLHLRWSLAGTMLTHFGLLAILIGALMGAIFGTKGFMEIPEGQATDTMILGRAISDKETLPFEVKLVDFILDTHEEPVHRLLTLDMKTQKERNHRIAAGQAIPLDEPRWASLASMFGMKPKTSGEIRIQRLLPNASMLTSLVEGPEQTGVAAIEFRLNAGESELRAYALLQPDSPTVMEDIRLGVAYTTAASEDAADAEIEKARSLFAVSSYLEVAVDGEKEPRKYPVEIGSTFAVEGADVSVEMLRYVPDFMMDLATREVVSKSDSPNNPAIRVRVTGPTGTTEQWLFSGMPSMHESTELPVHLHFRMNERLGAIDDYLLVVDVAESKPVLAHMREGKVLTRTAIEPGQSVAVEGTDYIFSLDKILRNANMKREVVEVADVSGRPAIEVAIGSGDSAEEAFLWDGAPVELPGYRMMYMQEERIRDFYSVLQVVDDGEIVAEKKIEVNDPLTYGGYTFYQSSYEMSPVVKTGLQVKKDPGVPVVYGGFVVQIAGMIIIFYVNPILRRSRRSRC